MNFSTYTDLTGMTLPDPFPGDEILIVAYEQVLRGEVLGSGRDSQGREIYHVFLTGPGDEDTVREVWVPRHEIFES